MVRYNILYRGPLSSCNYACDYCPFAKRAESRVELANYLLSLLDENADYQCESRHQRAAPHLGRVELASGYQDELSQPLTSVIGSLSGLDVNPPFYAIEPKPIGRSWDLACHDRIAR